MRQIARTLIMGLISVALSKMQLEYVMTFYILRNTETICLNTHITNTYCSYNSLWLLTSSWTLILVSNLKLDRWDIYMCRLLVHVITTYCRNWDAILEIHQEKIPDYSGFTELRRTLLRQSSTPTEHYYDRKLLRVYSGYIMLMYFYVLICK